MTKYLILFLITVFSCSTIFESFNEQSNKDIDEFTFNNYSETKELNIFNDNKMNNKERVKIPLEDFFKNPEKSSFKISPNGSFIAYMKPWEDGNRMMNIYVKSMDSNDELRITNASERSIYGFFWLSNNRIAYIQDKGGDENFRIYAVNKNGNEKK